MTVEHRNIPREVIESETFIDNFGRQYQLRQFATPEECTAAKDYLARQLNQFLAGDDVTYLVLEQGANRYAEYVKDRLTTFSLTEGHLKVSSYGNGTESSGNVIFDQEKLIQLIQPNKTLLIMEDVIDSGHTLHSLTKFIHNLPPEQKPSCIVVCTLFDKPARRSPEVVLQPNFVGMKLDDIFFVGEGPDYQDRHRELDGLYEVKFLPDTISSELSQVA